MRFIRYKSVILWLKNSWMDLLEQIKLPVADELEQYKALFESTLHHEDDLLNQALEHISRRKGKMMRPVLVLLMAKEGGCVTQASLHAAVTLELLHTASLVHDDVVDESGERRGQPSVNAVYNNKVAVLVGDYLLSSALEQASLTGDVRMVRRISVLGKSLSEGEMFQLSNIRSVEASEAAYYRIIRRKTAALFASCAELGALSAGAAEETVRWAFRFGEVVGTCFQIRDDIFDYFDAGSDLGKPTGNDMREGKLTLPVIKALQTGGSEAMRRLAVKVKQRTATDDEIASLVAFTKEQGGIAYAESAMESYHTEGRFMLQRVNDAALREALNRYLDFVVMRKW